MFPLKKATSANPGKRPGGFTLVEVLIAMAVGLILMAGVMAVVLSLARTAVKNTRVERTATTARQLQEFITQELSSAINLFNEDNEELTNRPTFLEGDGNSPTSYRQIHYRAPVGPPGALREPVAISSNTFQFFAPARLKPQAGDFLILDTPKLGSGITITAVADERAANTDGEITVTLAKSLAAGTLAGFVDAKLTHAPANSRVEVQRGRAFIVAPPSADAKTTTLRWSENTSGTTSKELTDQIAAEHSYLFRQVPDDETAPEVAIGWFLVLLDTSPTTGLPGRPIFFSSASIGGQNAGGSTSLILPKSGNSMALSNPFLSTETPITTRYSSSSTSSSKSSSSSTSSSKSSSSSTSSSKTSSSTSSSKTTSSKTSSSKSSSSSTSSSKTTSSKTSTSKTSSSKTTSSKTTSSKSSSSSTSSSKTSSSKTSSSKSSSSSTSSSKTSSSKTSSSKTSSSKTSSSKTSTSKTTTTIKGGQDG